MQSLSVTEVIMLFAIFPHPRRMFPGIVVSIGGLDPDIKYSISLEFNPVDNARYKYINTKWVNIGKAEAHCEEMLKYVHPESPSMGKHWMSSKISFKKIRVTNNKNHKKGSVSICHFLLDVIECGM